MTTINSGATHLALMAIQARPRNIGYTMPAREFASVDDAAAASAEARARLRGEVSPTLPPVIAHIPAAPPASAAAPEFDMEPVPGVPLNMLAPCHWRFLLRLASLASGIRVKDILSADRYKPVVHGRYLAMSLVYRHTQHSMPSVGRLFDRDHTTVLHGLVKTGSTAKLVDVEPEVVTDRAARPVAAVTAPTHPIDRNIIREGYGAGLSCAEIADQAGSTSGSVKVIAHQMGLRHRRLVSERVPEHLQEEYRHLRDSKKIPAAEIPAMLGFGVGA